LVFTFLQLSVFSKFKQTPQVFNFFLSLVKNHGYVASLAPQRLRSHLVSLGKPPSRRFKSLLYQCIFPVADTDSFYDKDAPKFLLLISLCRCGVIVHF